MTEDIRPGAPFSGLKMSGQQLRDAIAGLALTVIIGLLSVIALNLWKLVRVQQGVSYVAQEVTSDELAQQLKDVNASLLSIDGHLADLDEKIEKPSIFNRPY